MASISEEEEILEAAISGIPRVAQAVAAIPVEHRGRALDAAESSYRQTAQDLGYEEGPIQSWVSAVMFRLRAEVKKVDERGSVENLARGTFAGGEPTWTRIPIDKDGGER
jgi:hypothetical protein